MKSDLYKIRPLEWNLDHGFWKSKTPFGVYKICSTGGGENWFLIIGFGPKSLEITIASLEHGKQLAESDWQARILPALMDVNNERCDAERS